MFADEVRQLRADTQEQIERLLTILHQQTGCRVGALQLTIVTSGDGSSQKFRVEIELSL